MFEGQGFTEEAIIICCGLTLSTVGYLLMLLTAAVFPAWRRSQVNQLWLHMCGTKLLWGYVHSYYNLIYYMGDYIPAPWMNNILGHYIHITLANYLLLVSCCWALAGAWLAHRQLVNVMASRTEVGFIWKAALFAWLSPLPTRVTVSVVEYNFRKKVSNELYNTLRVIHELFAVMIVVCSVFLYSRVVYSLSRSGNNCGHRRNILDTAVLAGLFTLTSGLQYLFIICYDLSFIPSFTGGPFTKGLYTINLYITSYNVSMYALLFIVVVKKTREMWLEFLGKMKCSCSKNKVIPDATIEML